jgi:phosphomevalonate kinase
MSVVASAPGKIVVSGEYAVLVGAPALVAAVDRRTVCTLTDATSGGWRFTSHGLAADVTHSLAELVTGPEPSPDDPARLCAFVVRHLGVVGVALADLPRHQLVDIDSRAGFSGGVKLGVGTSAAVCVAFGAALLRRLGRTDDVFPLAYDAHRAAQGGRGSGIDIAGVCRGGLVRYATQPAPRTQRVAMPAIAFEAFASGAAADTGRHIASFDAWRAGGTPPALAALIAASARVADAVTDPRAFVRELRAYSAALRALDDVARLGIYSDAHRTLVDVAERHGVVYKPCGAGGGDLGAAFAIERAALEEFRRSARGAGFGRLSLELDEHGITIGAR